MDADPDESYFTNNEEDDERNINGDVLEAKKTRRSRELSNLLPFNKYGSDEEKDPRFEDITDLPKLRARK